MNGWQQNIPGCPFGAFLNLMTDVTQSFRKSGYYPFSVSFRRKPESSVFSMFWIPVFAGMTMQRNIS